MTGTWSRLAEALGNRLAFQVPLRDFTTFQLGGPARVLAKPEETRELQALLVAAREEGLPVLVLGGGSNLLFCLLSVGILLSIYRKGGQQKPARVPARLRTRHTPRI